MIVSFGQTYLQELYDVGKTKDKGHRFQPDIIQRYQKRVDTLMEVKDSEGLKKYNSLNFEALKGDKKGLYSIRVSDKYRIEFELSAQPDQTVLTICNIVELSNHYK